MAKKISQNSGAKRKSEQLVAQGLVLLDDRHNDQAIQHFRQAIMVGREAIGPYMKNLFLGFVKNKRHYEAASIGRPLTAFYSQDHELFNALGNQFRHLGKGELAQKCYKKSIQINPRWDIPYLNMAALSAKVDKYDEEINPLLHRFDDINDFVLPPFQGTHGFMDRIEAEIAERKGISPDKDLPKPPIFPQEIIDFFKDRVIASKELSPEKSPKAMKVAEGNLVNLALYCIKENEFAQAQDAIKQFKTIGSNYHYAEMLQAVVLGRQGQLEEAAELLKNSIRQNAEDRYINANLGLALRALGKDQLAKVYFVRAGYLLEQSFGYFSSQEIEVRAQELYQAKHYAEAQKLYQIIADTEPQPETWFLIGRCIYFQHDLSQSYQTMKKCLDQAQGEAQKKEIAKQVQEFWMGEAKFALESKKQEKALTLMEYALYFGRTPEILDKASQIAYNLGDTYKSGQYQQEYNRLLGLDRDSQLEAKRLKYIAEGKEALAKKDFQKAIGLFEQAFDLKLDKDVFVFLASIYKKLKYQRALSALINRWKWMQERAEHQALGKGGAGGSQESAKMDAEAQPSPEEK